MSSIHQLSVQQLHQAADLKEKIEGLQKELNQLFGSTTSSAAAPVAAKAAKKKGGLSAAGRANLVAAQKARWARIHAAKSAGKAVVAKPAGKAVVARKKFTMSAAAKAKISAAAKARWAKIKAAKK